MKIHRTYQRSRNLIDAMLNNSSIVFFLCDDLCTNNWTLVDSDKNLYEKYKDFSSYYREVKQKDYDCGRRFLEDLETRKLVPVGTTKRILGEFYNLSYLYSRKPIIIEISLYEFCKDFDIYRRSVLNRIKWHNYFESRGLSHYLFKKIVKEIAECNTGAQVAALLLYYQAYLIGRRGKTLSLNRLKSRIPKTFKMEK